MLMTDSDTYTTALAALAVRQGANVQPGQVVALASEPGKEAMARAIAEAAYAAGAKFVDLTVYDVYLKRARALHADRDSLGYVPPWLGARVLALGDERAARISLSGPVAPHALDDVDRGRVTLEDDERAVFHCDVANADVLEDVGEELIAVRG